MMNKKKTVAMLLAGGQGSRLAPLTKVIAKPAVPFGSKYRIIDFSLSNCVNSGIDTVGVLTQYQPLELNEYIGKGVPWDLNLTYGGVSVLPPYQGVSGADWYKGTANAIYQNLNFLDRFDPDYVVVLSGDHIYKMNYQLMLDEHIENNADCTIAVMDVPIEEASRFGIMNTNPDGSIYEFEEKPAKPKSTLASMGVYIFSYPVLKKYLTEDEADPESDNDFGKNVIPAMLGDGKRLFSYLYKGYWRDVGTLDSFWAANMDTIGENPVLTLNDDGWKIYYRHNFEHPQYLGETAEVENCAIGEGSHISGKVEGSVLFSNVTVEEGAVVKDCVIMKDVKIRKGAKVEYAIIDAGAEIGENAKVGGAKEENDITVIATEVKVCEGGEVASGTILEQDV